MFGTLHAAGVCEIFISPGSRSTPFTWQALATIGLRCHAIVDERCAAFAALGLARATDRPVALLCTSGSAPAHYLPALVEASLSHVPLLVISADRPMELQHTGAAQTIDQVKLYGNHVRRYFELGSPDPAPTALLGLRRTINQAVAIARAPSAGPVHVNAPARKPLEPIPASSEAQRALHRRVSELLLAPLTRRVAALSAPPPLLMREIAHALATARAGVIVLGPLPAQHRALATPVAALATALGFPVMAEAASQLRFALSGHAQACPEFPWLLDAEPVRRRYRPDIVLCLGTTPTCAGFDAWARDPVVARYVLTEHEGADASGTARILATVDLAMALELLRREVAAIEAEPTRAQRIYAQELLAAAGSCRVIIAEELAREPPMAEGAAVACVMECLPEGAYCLLGNSLPIRDVDAYVRYAAPIVVSSQRGANGIDGLVSGAAGSALGTRAPTLLLIGDVSLLHDLGGLAVAASLETPLVLVVLDNAGGRIFDQLPIHALYASDPALASFWRTPVRCELRHAAAAFGVHYAAPATATALAAATRAALHTDAATLLHVRVGPDSARRVRERVLARLCISAAPA